MYFILVAISQAGNFLPTDAYKSNVGQQGVMVRNSVRCQFYSFVCIRLDIDPTSGNYFDKHRIYIIDIVIADGNK